MSDHTRLPADAPLSDHLQRTARIHTTNRQRGARVTDFVRTLSGRFDLATTDGRDRLNAEVATLVEDEILISDDHNGTTYYRLAADVNGT